MPEPDAAELPEKPDPVEEQPQGRGWGVIAKFLGLHPGVLGKGTGDKFYPEPDPNELPDLPEVTADAEDTVKNALARTRFRTAKQKRKQAHAVAKQEKGRKNAEKIKAAKVKKGKNSFKDKAANNKPDKTNKSKPDKPGRAKKK
jgi:hypothetical protein